MTEAKDTGSSLICSTANGSGIDLFAGTKASSFLDIGAIGEAGSLRFQRGSSG